MSGGGGDEEELLADPGGAAIPQHRWWLTGCPSTLNVHVQRWADWWASARARRQHASTATKMETAQSGVDAVSHKIKACISMDEQTLRDLDEEMRALRPAIERGDPVSKLRGMAVLRQRRAVREHIVSLQGQDESLREVMRGLQDVQLTAETQEVFAGPVSEAFKAHTPSLGSLTKLQRAAETMKGASTVEQHVQASVERLALYLQTSTEFTDGGSVGEADLEAFFADDDARELQDQQQQEHEGSFGVDFGVSNGDGGADVAAGASVEEGEGEPREAEAAV